MKPYIKIKKACAWSWGDKTPRKMKSKFKKTVRQASKREISNQLTTNDYE